MKRFLLPLILAVALLPSALSRPARSQDALKIFCWSPTPQTQAVLGGLERVLGRSLPVVEAGGDYAQGEIVVRQLAAEKPKLLIVLGTQALALTAPRIKKTPVVFAMVADPYQTGAAYNRDHPEDHQENITGIASPPPMAAAIEQTLKLFPAKRHWGLIYDPTEGPSLELRQIFSALASQAGLKVTAISASSEAAAVDALSEFGRRGVQVVFLPPDNFARQYADQVLAMGNKQRFVVINGNPRITGQGAVLRITLDYTAVGEQAGHLVQRLLAGEKPKAVPITLASPVQAEVNESLLNLWAGYPPGKH